MRALGLTLLAAVVATSALAIGIHFYGHDLFGWLGVPTWLVDLNYMGALAALYVEESFVRPGTWLSNDLSYFVLCVFGDWLGYFCLAMVASYLVKLGLTLKGKPSI